SAAPKPCLSSLLRMPSRILRRITSSFSATAWFKLSRGNRPRQSAKLFAGHCRRKVWQKSRNGSSASRYLANGGAPSVARLARKSIAACSRGVRSMGLPLISMRGCERRMTSRIPSTKWRRTSRLQRFAIRCEQPCGRLRWEIKPRPQPYIVVRLAHEHVSQAIGLPADQGETSIEKRTHGFAAASDRADEAHIRVLSERAKLAQQKIGGGFVVARCANVFQLHRPAARVGAGEHANIVSGGAEAQGCHR